MAAIHKITINGTAYDVVTDTYSSTSTTGMSGKAVASAVPTITNTYSATSSNGMSGKAVASAISGKANSADLKTVATTGSYNDLTNKPTIPTSRTFTNITVNAVPSALSSYCAWDTQQLYGYYFDVTVSGITTNTLIKNLVMTDTLLSQVGYIVTTNTNKLTFYTESDDQVSGTIITLITEEV